MKRILDEKQRFGSWFQFCYSLCDHEQTVPSLSLNFSSCYGVDFFEAQMYTQVCVYIVHKYL